jgi:hypothetical protein
MIVDASHWPQLERDALVDWVFDHPHPYVTEDITFSARVFGIDEAACRQMFKAAPVFGAILLEGKPLYIFSVAENGHASTASEQRLEAHRWFMTKHLVRLGRSEMGRKMLAGSIGFAEESDLLNGTVRHRWLEAIGYRPYAPYQLNEYRFVCYAFQGGP